MCFCAFAWLRLCAFVFLLGCVFVLVLVHEKSFCKKKKEFKTALMTSFTLHLIELKWMSPVAMETIFNLLDYLNIINYCGAIHSYLGYRHTTGNRHRFDIDITSIHQRPNFDEFPHHFHVLFQCNFADWNIHVVSTYFFKCNFAGQKIRVVSTYFLGVILRVEKSTLFIRTFSV